MEIWLVRHGSTCANLEGRLQGRKDYPLSRQGENEALCLASRLKKERFSYIFCSDLARARQTARFIYNGLEKKPLFFLTPLLREYHWGVLQGLTPGEIKDRYPATWQRLQDDFHHAPVPGAEGWRRIVGRAGRLFQALQLMHKKSRPSLPILVVGHGRFLQALIIFALRYPPSNHWPFSLAPASLTILECENPSRCRLKLFNDTCHFRWFF